MHAFHNVYTVINMALVNSWIIYIFAHEILRMRRVVAREKVFFENERDSLPKLRKISNVIWK